MNVKMSIGVDPMQHEETGNLFKGLLWGSLLSMPIWFSVFGWIKLFLWKY